MTKLDLSRWDAFTLKELSALRSALSKFVPVRCMTSKDKVAKRLLEEIKTVMKDRNN